VVVNRVDPRADHAEDLQGSPQGRDEPRSDGPTPGVSRRRLTSRQRRKQLLDVAGELIEESGLGAITMERVAQRAGVSKGIMYRHFVNADDLIVALFQREVVDNRSEVRDALEANPDRSSEAGFRAFFSRIVESNHGVFDVLTQTTATSGPLREAQEALTDESEAYFARLYHERLNLSEASANIAAAFVLAGLKGSIRAWDRGYGSADDIEQVVVAMIDGGLQTLANRKRRGSTVPADESADQDEPPHDTARADGTRGRS
jgi:AcrR family transcriptional regulator